MKISYFPIPDWFRQNPKLTDKLESPLLLDKIPKKPKWRPALQNAIDITVHEVFKAMEGNDDGRFNRGMDGGARADGVVDEIVTGADERAHRR